MTQKRILRANSRNAARERDLLLRDAFRIAWADIDDPDAEKLISQLAADRPDDTSLELFGMVNQLLDEVAESTGETRDTILARLRRR